MKRKTDAFYRAGEFAELAGVTVRTLHHYDELDLLRPSAHSEAGYRLYTLDDLARLTHIQALRFIGMPLKDIRQILDGENLALADALRLQRTILVQRRAHLDAIISAIDRADAAVAQRSDTQWSALREVMQAMNEQRDWNWVKEHYTPEQLERLGKRYDPAMQETWSKQWSTLLADVDAAKNDDPASPASQALAQRWSDMLALFTNNEPDIEESLKNVYRDPNARNAVPMTPDTGAFITRALAILKGK
jgi:MerR family transcriptional regulator, thiopeptide resistance regulator